jgi:hypothetical protein
LQQNCRILAFLGFLLYHAFSKMNTKAIAYFILGWFIPGLGHVALKKFKRALFFFVAISSMAVLGLLMGGRVYSFQTENPLTILAFFSDIGTGSLYLLTKMFSFGLGNLKNISFEFGTAYIAGAGLLNFLIALDAFDIAAGKKN